MPRTRVNVALTLATIVTIISSLGLGLPTAAAQSDTLTIPASTVIRGNQGDIVELGRLTVDSSLAGPLCTWTATVTNQASVHPNSDILVESNGTTLVVPDVEATPNQVTSNSGSVALAAEVVVSVRLGPDGRFSGRMEVAIDYSMCGPTTTIVDTTTTTLAETTTSTLATTEPEVDGPDVSADESTTTAPTTAAPTTAAPTTTQPTEATDVLPVTGSGLAEPIVAAGFIILASGLALNAVAHQRGRLPRER